jgi:chromosomal replication initiation ATPase DnaA
MSTGDTCGHRGLDWTRDENGEPIPLPRTERPTPALRLVTTTPADAFERARARRDEILPDVESVIAACEGMYGLARGTLRVKDRRGPISRARKVAVFVAVKMLHLTEAEAAKEINRDRSSAYKAVDWAERRLEDGDVRLKNELAILADVLGVEWGTP